MALKSKLKEKEPRKSFMVDYDERSQSMILTIFDDNILPLGVRVYGVTETYWIILTKKGGMQMRK